MNNVLITQNEGDVSTFKRRTPHTRLKTQHLNTEPSEPEPTTIPRRQRSPSHQFVHFPKLNRFYGKTLDECSLRDIITESPSKHRKQLHNMQVSFELNKLTEKPEGTFLRYRVSSARAFPRQHMQADEPVGNHFVKKDVFERVRSNKQLLKKITSVGGTAPLRLKIDKRQQQSMQLNNRYFDNSRIENRSPNKSAMGNRTSGIIYKPLTRTYTDHDYFEGKREASRANIKAGQQLYVEMMGIMRNKLHDWLAD